jgi:hypothetical protein
MACIMRRYLLLKIEDDPKEIGPNRAEGLQADSNMFVGFN